MTTVVLGIAPSDAALIVPVEEVLGQPGVNGVAHTCYTNGDWAGLLEELERVPMPYQATSFVAQRDIEAIEASITRVQELLVQHPGLEGLMYCAELDELDEELVAARKVHALTSALFGLGLFVIDNR